MNKILIVDDGRVFASIFAKHLSPYSIEVARESEPAGIIKYAKNEKPAIIFLDRTLKSTNGLTIYKKLKNNSNTKDIPVILICGALLDSELQEITSLGIFSILRKPFGKEELLKNVNRFIPLSLPQAQPKRKRQREEAPSVIIPEAGKGNVNSNAFKILIVDDDPILQKMVAAEFHGENFSTTLASNGKEALDKLQGEKFDFITSDLEMPVMDGLELCSAVKTNPETASIPILLLTGANMHDARTKGFAAGASEFFVKPFKKGELKTYINDLIGKLKSKIDRTVIVVAKNVSHLHMFAFMLKKKGLKAELFTSLKDARDFTQKNDIDLAIIEKSLSDATGLELVNLLRSEGRDGYLPIIYLSEEKTDDDLRLAFASRVNFFLQLPFMEEEFHGLLNATIGTKRIFDDLQTKNNILHDLSITDGMTKLYNKSFTEKYLEERFKEAVENGGSLGCFFIDADHFKQVNDEYGHDFGDIVLKGLAKKLQKHTPKNALAGRFGGEEFVMILPDMNFSQCCSIADNLRIEVENHLFTDGRTEINKTVSIGVCSYPEIAVERFSDLLKNADQALYNAKKNGRNQVWRYSPLDNEENLVDEMKIFRQMFLQAADGILSIDLDGRIRHFNEAAEKLFQYSADEVLGQRIEILLPGRFHHKHVMQINNYIRTGMPKIDTARIVPAQKKNGEEFKIDLTVSKLGSEDQTGFLAIMREVQ